MLYFIIPGALLLVWWVIEQSIKEPRSNTFKLTETSSGISLLKGLGALSTIVVAIPIALILGIAAVVLIGGVFVIGFKILASVFML